MRYIAVRATAWLMAITLSWAQSITVPVLAQAEPAEATASTAAAECAEAACSAESACAAAAYAAGANPAAGSVNLDLASTVATLTAPLTMTQSVDVSLAGTIKSIGAGAAVTPAEMVALQQVVQTGVQTLVLDSFGAAQSGTLNLGTHLSSILSSLTIPAGVTVLVNSANASSVSLTGDLANSGSLYFYSNNPAVASASLSALNIYNNQSAILSTVLPTALQTCLNSQVASMSLNLSAINNIVNAGTISSAGSLNVFAGGSITNALPAGVTGANPVMQAMQSITMTSMLGNITNAGIIAATTGNINVMTAQTANLALNNLNGVMQALNGAINVRDSSYTGSALTSLYNGNYLSKELNVYGGKGIVDINVGNITGVVNAWAECLHISADAPLLQLGMLNATGDPYVTVSGDLDLSSTTYSPYLVAIAGKNIFTSGGSTSLTTGGGNLVLIAGATPTGAPGGVTVDRSGQGGDIYLISGGTFGSPSPVPSQNIVALDTSNNVGVGGNVTLIAYADSATSQTYGGKVLLPANVEIDTYGGGSNANGNLTIVAESSAPGDAVNIGNINNSGTTFGTGGGGLVVVSVSTPRSGASSPVVNTANGNVTGSFNSGLSTDLQNGVADVNAIYTPGAVTLSAGGGIVHSSGTIKTPTLTVTSNSGDIGTDPNASGRALTIAANTLFINTAGDVYINQTGPITVGNTVANGSSIISLVSSSNVTFGGTVTTSGGSGGAINISSGGSIFTTNTSASITVAGSINLVATSGSIGSPSNPLIIVAGGSTNFNSPSTNVQLGATAPANTVSAPEVEETEPVNPFAAVLAADSASANNSIGATTIIDTQTTSNVNVNTASMQASIAQVGTETLGLENAISSQNMIPTSPVSVPNLPDAPSPTDTQALGQNFAYCEASTFDANTVGAMQAQGAQIGTQTTSNFCVLQQGNFMFQPQADITVRVQEGDVLIPEGAMALVMETGNDVAVLDIHDGPHAAVRVRAGKKMITLSPGKQVVLTRQMAADFDQINPVKLIGYRNVKSEVVANDIRAFAADFSMPSAMMNVAPLKRLLLSDNRADRARAHRMLKHAVVMAALTPEAEPYKTSRAQH